jgi:hypothetical protein
VTANRHLVDRLADVREEIKRLQAVEAEIRDALLEDGADLRGDEWYASIVRRTTSRLNRKLLDGRYGKAAVDDCCKKIEVQRIRLVRPESEVA